MEAAEGGGAAERQGAVRVEAEGGGEEGRGGGRDAGDAADEPAEEDELEV